MLLGEADVGEDVLLGLVHADAKLGPAGPQLIGDLPPGLGRGRVVGLQEHLPDGRRDDGGLPLGT